MKASPSISIPRAQSYAAPSASSPASPSPSSPGSPTHASWSQSPSFSLSSSSSSSRSPSCCSRLTFSYLNRLFTIGTNRGHLDIDDVDELCGDDATEDIADRFQTEWRKQQDMKKAKMNEQRRRDPSSTASSTISFVSPLFRMYGCHYICLGMLKLICDCFIFTGPIFLGYLLRFVESYQTTNVASSPTSLPSPSSSSGGDPLWHGYVFASCLVLCVLASTFISSHYSYLVRRLGIRIRSCLSTSIYRHSLRMTLSSRESQFTDGLVTNLMSTDVDRIVDQCVSIHECWSLPVQIGIALYLLYTNVGWSLLGGLLIVVLLVPINAYITYRINIVTQAMLIFKDERISLLSDSIRHIRMIKFQSLESNIIRRIMVVRRREMEQLAKRKYLDGQQDENEKTEVTDDAVCVYVWATTPILISLVTFASYSLLLHRPLTSDVVFTSLSLFGILIRPLNSWPWVINGLVEGRISALRVNRYLNTKEFGDQEDEQHQERGTVSITHEHRMTIDDTNIAPADRVCQQEHHPVRCVMCIEGTFDFVQSKIVNPADASSSSVVSIDDSLSSSSPSPLPAPALSDLFVHVHSGSSIGVCGAVGAGKTNLLRAILGELTLRPGSGSGSGPSSGPGPGAGERYVKGHVAYVAQESWIPSGTFRESILFHRPFDQVWYDRVLDACALRPDIASMAGGEYTELGGGGVNLSGGQLMRLALARALYASSDVDLFVFDDPLSSVDAHVASHIVREVFGPRGLLQSQGKARIIVVAQTEELIRRHVDKMWTMHDGRIVKEEICNREREETSSYAHAGAEVASSASIAPSSSSRALSPSTSFSSPSPSSAPSKSGGLDASEVASLALLGKGYLTVEESRARGAIRSAVLKSYLGFVGLPLLAAIGASMVMMQGSKNASDYWLSYWVTSTSVTSDSSSTSTAAALDSAGTMRYLRVFAYIALGNTVAALFRSFIFAYGGLVAARRLFSRLLKAVMRAPISFFDAQPLGRIINRFSTDIYSVDDSIPFQTNVFLAQLFSLLGSIVVISVVVPSILLLIPVLGIAYNLLQRRYRSVSREIRRLDSTSRSPIYALFADTLSGVESIRAFGVTAAFDSRNVQVMDANQRVSLTSTALSSWLNMRLQMIGVCVVFVVCALTIVSCVYPRGWMRFVLNPDLVGLALAYALPLTDTLNGLIGSATDTEKEIISVERAVEYIKVQPENADRRGMKQLSEGKRSNKVAKDKEHEREQEKQRKESRARDSKRVSRISNVGINKDLSESLLVVHSASDHISSPISSLTSSISPLLISPSSMSSSSSSSLGRLSFRSVSMRYRPDLDFALRCVSFDIRARERVGIVGRTGGGKTSIIQCLFAMREIEADDGQGSGIFVDGVDIRTIRRDVLRHRMAVIPQSPIMFQGTIRDNLWPYGQESRRRDRRTRGKRDTNTDNQDQNDDDDEDDSDDDEDDDNDLPLSHRMVSDDEIWLVLRECQMEEKVRSMSKGLSTMYTSSTRLSVGERQLLCIARAILRRSDIIVMDEATASVDPHTVAILHAVILRLPSTVLVVAHRLRSILNFDRVIVMRDGRVAEFDAPSVLIARKDSTFAQLVEQETKNMAKEGGTKEEE